MGLEITKQVLNSVEEDIRVVTNGIAELLIDKNRRYGNSALDPVRIFSKADPVEQIRVRIDDKLSRIVRGEADDGEDAVTDLTGYLVLLKVAEIRQKRGQVVQSVEAAGMGFVGQVDKGPVSIGGKIAPEKQDE